MTIVRPMPVFNARDLQAGDIIEKDDERKFSGTLFGFRCLVLGPAREEDGGKYIGPVLKVPVYYFKDNQKGIIEYTEDEIVEDRVFRDGGKVWDYDDRL